MEELLNLFLKIEFRQTIFNARINSGNVVTIRLTHQLRNKIRDQQEIFECISGNVTTAFNTLLNLINIIELDVSKSNESELANQRSSCGLLMNDERQLSVYSVRSDQSKVSQLH
jgi:CRISPR/Cas system type I-B associated protein Csh2 (Cas7 group RAMP superfamily)